jgi:hypothetical protein
MRILRKFIRTGPVAFVIWAITNAASFGQDIGAVGNGAWNNAATWMGTVVPASSSNVYIGSMYPTGAATMATVTISGSDELANNVYLGDGAGTSGTLDISGGFKLLISNPSGSLTLGENGGTGSVVESTGGFFNVPTVNVENGSSLGFGASDVATTLVVETGSTATTAATGNVTGNVGVFGGSTLNLGASLTISQTLDVRDTNTVINMNGHSITANNIYLGWYDGQAVTLNRGGAGGTLTANVLRVGNESFNLLSTDKVGALFLTNATSSLNSGVTVSTLGLFSSSTASTTETGNVTAQVQISSGSTLNLGANMNITGNFQVQDAGSIVNMNGYSITAAAVFLGWNGSAAVTLDRGGAGGTLTSTELLVGHGTFSLVAGDTTAVLELASNATVTTAAVGNITSDVSVASGSTLNLGANLNLTGPSNLAITGQINIQDAGSTLNAQGHAIAADSLLVGVNGTSAVSVTNLGLVTLNTLDVGHGSMLTLHGGDTINTSITLSGGSVLTVDQTNGTGLTFNGTSLSSLTIDPSSIDLIFTASSSPNWDFRWKDPSGGGNWIGAIEAMIGSGEILGASGYSVYDSGGYTYIGISTASVPEPSSLVLACLATAVVAVSVARRRRDTGR